MSEPLRVSGVQTVKCIYVFADIQNKNKFLGKKMVQKIVEQLFTELKDVVLQKKSALSSLIILCKRTLRALQDKPTVDIVTLHFYTQILIHYLFTNCLLFLYLS